MTSAKLTVTGPVAMPKRLAVRASCAARALVTSPAAPPPITIMSCATRSSQPGSTSLPEFRESCVPAAAIAIELVSHGVLPVVVLVVRFGGIERPGGHDLRHDRRLEPPRLLQRPPGLLSRRPLPGIVVEDRRAILMARIAELS